MQVETTIRWKFADDYCSSFVIFDVAILPRGSGNRAAAQRPPLDAARQRLEVMLGVVSYCYTKGLFSSSEIEERLWAEPAFLATFGTEPPTAARIRCFRREHREDIIATIEHALQDFCARPASPAGHHKIICATAGAMDWAKKKAHELLDMAKFTDSMERDSY